MAIYTNHGEVSLVNYKMPEEFQERQVAVKTRITDIQEGKYVTEEGWTPNYLLTTNNHKISRSNLMGIVVDRETNGTMVNLVLDDGSGSIKVRSFEEITGLNLVEIGTVVLVIGKIRVYGEEKYIAPEIIKPIDKEWLKVRNLELAKIKGPTEDKTDPTETMKNSLVEEIKSREGFESDNKQIIEMIKKLDSGEGVLIEEIKEKSQINQIDTLIDKMLKEGEIFQNLPGKVKVL